MSFLRYNNRSKILLLGFVLLLIFQSCKKDNIEPDFLRFKWETSSPEVQGMNSDILDSAFIEARSLGFIDGLLVIRNGYIVKEEYFNGYTKDTPHNVKSVSKSFLSALTGIAINKEYIDNVDVKMLNYFPEYIYDTIDSRKYDISIEHLLTMRMGIPGEQDNNYGVYQEIYNSSNWVQTTIQYPLAYSPGERMRYNTFQTHLLSVILARSGGINTFDLAEDLLTNPMGIDIDSWEQDPQGNYFGGNSMFFTLRESAALGYMYLNKGKLNNSQIVPAEWVELTISPSTNALPNEWGALKNYNYAWLWWLGYINDYEVFFALGYGGQFVVCFPELDLIIAVNSIGEVYPDTAETQELDVLDIMADYVVPSINNKSI